MTTIISLSNAQIVADTLTTLSYTWIDYAGLILNALLVGITFSGVIIANKARYT